MIRMQHTRLLLLSGFALVPTLVTAQQGAPPPQAEVRLQPLSGSGVSGTVMLEQKGNSVAVNGTFNGLSPGKHGFHIHEGRSCTSRGSHFSPSNTLHGAPDSGDDKHHLGDLGNIDAQGDGTASYSGAARKVTLIGENSIDGRVLVVHRSADDLYTQPSGNSGEHLACGVIKVMPQ